MARQHDDAHRPLGGKGQRGNRTTRRAPNWGGAALLTAPVCQKCGVMMGRYCDAWRFNGCGANQTPNGLSTT
jgi:hypothetical protein